MKTIRLCLTILTASILFYSCATEYSREGVNTTPPATGGNNATSILGDYDFVGIAANTNTTINATQGPAQLKSIATTSYTSNNNSGTVRITGSEFIFSDIAYSIHTTVKTQSFLNGVPVGVTDVPFDIDSPVTGDTEGYTKNSEDSITFPNPIFITTSAFNGNIDPTPMGTKLSWSGDTLYLKVIYSFTGDVSQNGIAGTFIGNLDGIIKLKKK
jgi:hypothetical protein